MSRKTHDQDGFAISFSEGLLHFLQHAGLARHTPVSLSEQKNRVGTPRSSECPLARFHGQYRQAWGIIVE